MIKKILLFLFLTLTYGCSSGSQPIAKIPLVNVAKEVEEKPVSAELQEILNLSESQNLNSQSGSSLNIYPVFYSARGILCRFVHQRTSKYLYCQNKEGRWFSVPSILSEVQPLSKSNSE